jgi:hypothetical protein
MSRNKYAKAVDANQRLIVEFLRAHGLTVFCAHAVGGGFTDLVVRLKPQKFAWLVEVKDGDKPPSARKLTKAQVDFHAEWAGCVTIIENVEQAAALVSTIKGER